MSDHWLDRKEFWRAKCALVGSYVVEILRRAQERERGCREVFVPRSKDYDLTELPAAQRLYGDARPDIVIHPSASLRANSAD